MYDARSETRKHTAFATSSASPSLPIGISPSLRRTYSSSPLAAEAAERFARLAEASVAEQKEIEAADTLPFESWRQLYLAPFRLNE